MALSESDRFMDLFITRLSGNNKSIPSWSVSSALRPHDDHKQENPVEENLVCRRCDGDGGVLTPESVRAQSDLGRTDPLS